MKTCIECGKELPNPIDEFGEIGEEMCQSCFLNYQWKAMEHEKAAIPYEIERLKGEIESLKDDIENAEDELSDMKTELYDKEERMAQIARDYPELFEEAEQLAQGELHVA